MHVQNHRRQQFLQNRTAATPSVFLNSCKKMLARVFCGRLNYDYSIPAKRCWLEFFVAV
ncbi:hypothetical protein HanPSC8_Chr11g0468421 [Helianthus annuus]|nr:hypothetical protein HanPSC8_Chr11g0468421 [Helianthus annuus]